MNTVLVTIVGPDGRADAVAPADVPLRELLATFAQLAAGVRDDAGDDARWELGPPGHPPLLASGTLDSHGVADGGVLHLRRSGTPLDAPPRNPAPGPAPDGSTPVARTRDALPEWLHAGERMRAALRAALGTADDVRGPAMIEPSTSRRARARASWRATDYRRALEDAIAGGPLRQPVTIAVISPRAGAGRSTVALALGGLLDRLRSERVVNVRATSAADGEPADPFGVGALGDGAGVIVVDCGPGLDDPAARAALLAADQIVLVVEPDDAAPRLLAAAGEWLVSGGPSAVVVVNKLPPRGLDIGWLEREMPDARGLIALHSDPRQAARLGSVPSCGRDPYGAWSLPLRELAAVLVEDWSRRGS